MGGDSKSPALIPCPIYQYGQDTDGYVPIRIPGPIHLSTPQFANDFGITGEHMGGVFSGNRSPRQGKERTRSLPEVKLTHARLYTVTPNSSPTVTPHPDGWATVRWHQAEWPVWLSESALHFGGHRRWLVCPMCFTRRQSLFIAREVLRCRQCLNLAYDSQNENARARGFRRADKIRSRLGWPPGVLSPEGAKPTGMHHRTYRALKDELNTLRKWLMTDVTDWLRQAEDALDLRK